MPVLEAIRLALSTIRAQKLKSFFSLIGVLIGVTFLIAVVSIVQGMNRYMQDRFANGLIGVNTFEVRRFPAIDNGSVTADTWREWLRRPRVNYPEAAFVKERVKTPAIYARTCFEDNMLVSQGALRGKFFPGVDPLDKALTIAGLPYRIIGVLEKQGTLFGFSLDRFALVPFTSP